MSTTLALILLSVHAPGVQSGYYCVEEYFESLRDYSTYRNTHPCCKISGLAGKHAFNSLADLCASQDGYLGVGGRVYKVWNNCDEDDHRSHYMCCRRSEEAYSCGNDLMMNRADNDANNKTKKLEGGVALRGAASGSADRCWTYNGAICEYLEGAHHSQCYDSSFQCESAHTQQPTPQPTPKGCWTYNGTICEYVVGANSSQCYESPSACEDAPSQQPRRLSSIMV